MAPVSSPDRFPTSELFGDTVTVKVGTADAARNYTLHKGVLIFYSEFFTAALKEDTFVEGRERVIDLSTEDVWVFADFVRWLYTRRAPEHRDLVADGEFATIVKLWIFADRRQIPLLANTMINEFRDAFVRDWILPTRSLNTIYENSCADASLRRLSSVILSYGGAEDTMIQEKRRECWPPDALWDVLKLTLKMRDNGAKRMVSKADFAAMDLCEYHIHEEGVRCGSKT